MVSDHNLIGRLREQHLSLVFYIDNDLQHASYQIRQRNSKVRAVFRKKYHEDDEIDKKEEAQCAVEAEIPFEVFSLKHINQVIIVLYALILAGKPGTTLAVQAELFAFLVQ